MKILLLHAVDVYKRQVSGLFNREIETWDKNKERNNGMREDSVTPAAADSVQIPEQKIHMSRDLRPSD